jgi:hypothetical protein
MRSREVRGEAMAFGRVQRTIASEYDRVLRPRDARVRLAVLTVVLAIGAERWTAVPGLSVLLAVIVIYAPMFLFVRFWRFLIWLRGRATSTNCSRDGIYAIGGDGNCCGWRSGSSGHSTSSRRCGSSFSPASMSYTRSPCSLHGVAGTPGVVLAGASYAGLVVAITRKLPAPIDFDFLVAAALWYGILVVHNYVLLLGGKV